MFLSNKDLEVLEEILAVLTDNNPNLAKELEKLITKVRVAKKERSDRTNEYNKRARALLKEQMNKEN